MRRTNGSGIYVSSRATVPERVETWRALRAEGHDIVSSWIDETDAGRCDWSDLWERISREIAGCARLVVYVEPDDLPLKGVLVEIGMALANGVPVVVVAPGVVLEPRSMRPLGSWLAHPLVARCDTLAEAFALPCDHRRSPASTSVPAMPPERLSTPPIRRHLTPFHQLHGLDREVVPSRDMKMPEAGPTRLARGTMPTPPSSTVNRLSRLLSRLSPRTK